MSNRTVRVNELVQRELNDILRQHYQSEAVAITIAEVRVAPDLHDAKVFVAIEDGAVRARVWERGSGETMACGTGACAALVAANEAGLVPARAEVRFPGGTLVVERTQDDVYLTGPAECVFVATLDEAWLAARGL